ncbi:hypothetical protein XK07_02440 [Campylobacter lari]|nr:hypothetical protein [Campylobacter lari]
MIVFLSILKSSFCCHFKKNTKVFYEFYEEIQNNEIYKTLAKNTLLVKELYGLSDDEFSYMISTFKVLNEKQSEYIALLRN